MAWGLSLAGVVGVVLGLVGPVGCPWWGSVVVVIMGLASPWCGHGFLDSLCIWRWLC